MPRLLKESPQHIEQCVEYLATGGVVALPTETVYGLAAQATHDIAVRSVFQWKGRPAFNPLIVHVYDGAHAGLFAHLSDLIHHCIQRFWPGPLTLICPLKSDHGLAEGVYAGLDTVALRVPSHPVMRRVLKELGQPLAAPSANVSGYLSCTHACDVAQSFAARDPSDALWILDGGACAVGLESTVVDTTCTPWMIVRQGAIGLEELQKVLGPRMVVMDPDIDRPVLSKQVRSPGQLLRHYAPRLPLRMHVTQPHEGEAFVGFGPMPRPCTINLSLNGCLTEAAACLFRALHSLDRADLYRGIAVAPIPYTGVGLAINDRLKRAAACASTHVFA